MGRLANTIYGVPPSEESGETCLVAQALATMDGEDLIDFEDMLRKGGKVGGRRISAALAQINISISGTAINEHRARICRCYRKVVSNG